MFDAITDYEVGTEYCIGKLLVQDRELRDKMIGLGLVPGEVIQLVRSVFFGRYWVVRVRKQLIGLRLSELQRLQLHDIHH